MHRVCICSHYLLVASPAGIHSKSDEGRNYSVNYSGEYDIDPAFSVGFFVAIPLDSHHVISWEICASVSQMNRVSQVPECVV